MEQALLARTPWSLTFSHLARPRVGRPNFSGKPHWVQTGIFDCCMLSDGTSSLQCLDEAHKEIGFYKDGQAFGGFSGGCAPRHRRAVPYSA